jgi:thiamine kinase-like enzyme
MPRNRSEELAQRWVPGEGPVEVQPLASGLVNQSWRVTRSGSVYSLRIAAAEGGDLGFDRRWECAVRARAGAAGLAPVIRRCEPRLGIVVAEWATGRSWSAAETRRPANIDLMARLLRQVHALEIPLPSRGMTPVDWIAHYRRALSRDGHRAGGAAGTGAAAAGALRPATLALASETRLAMLAGQPPAAAVLCHSDLHRFNVLIGKRAVLLDWEYAHVSDAFWDLAGWVANNDWTALEARRLLADYLLRPVRAMDWERLQTWTWLYDYVCLLWSELYLSRRAGAQGGEVAARAQVLAERLGSN